MPQRPERRLTDDLLRDQRQRWSSGQRRTVAEYLAEHRWLRSDEPLLVELIRAEFTLRQSADASVDPAEYLERFPDLASQLVEALSTAVVTRTLPAVRNAAPPGNEADTHSLRAANPDSTQPHVAGEHGSAQSLASVSTCSADRFDIVRSHAKGGLGEVFVASDRELNREVALKQMQAKLADHAEARSRFVLEAEITGMLEHPGIVPVYSLGADPNGSPFYAMRFIRGESLHDAIRSFHAEKVLSASERSVEFRQLLGRFVSVCHAIAYAHSRGVLHRDLKPDNIMLGDYGETLVVDWGLAKALGGADLTGDAPPSSLPPVRPRAQQDAAASQLGQVIGTPAYMPPEQAAGKLGELGPAADIYSLGATLFTLLTGERPFKGKNAGEVLDQVRAGQVVRPVTIDPAVPKPLEAICLKAMSLQPKDRYAACFDLAQEVERWLADEPVAAYPEPLPARMRRWIRKHPGPVAAAAATVALGLLSAGTLAYLNGKHAAELSEKNVTITKQKIDLEQTNVKLVEAREEAVQEKVQAEGVTEFLVTSFRKADPDQDGKKLTVYEVLVRANQEIDAQPNLDPLQKAEMLYAVGQSFLGLGMFQQSISSTERAHSIFQAQLGPDHHTTLSCQCNLAGCYAASGRLDLALPLCERTLNEMKAALGEDHPSTQICMNELASQYKSAGKLDLALPLHEKALRLMKATLGEDDPTTLAALNNVALDYQGAGRPDLALPLFEQSLQRGAAQLGEDHSDVLMTASNLASCYKDLARLDLALPLYEKSERLCKARFGNDHPLSLSLLNGLADCHRSAGNLDQALPRYQESLRLTKAKLGEDHPQTLIRMSNLALGYQAGGKYDLALPLLEQALKLNEAALGEDHPESLTFANNLANCYQAANKLSLVVPLFEKTLRLTKAKLGDDHPDTLLLMHNLAVAHQNAGDLELAMTQLEETLQLTKAKLGEGHTSTLVCMHSLAGAYEAAGKLEMALPLQEESLRLLKATLGNDHPTTLIGMNNLAVCHLKAGNLELAMPLYEETLRLSKAKLGDDHPETLNSMRNLAKCYQTAGKLDLAVPLMEESLRLTKARFGDEHPDTLDSQGVLGSSYLQAKAPEKAIPLLRSMLEGKRRLIQDDVRWARLATQVATDLVKHEQFAAAESIYRLVLPIDEEKQPGSALCFISKSKLGESLAGQRKFAEAEPLLVSGCEGLIAQQETLAEPLRSLAVAAAIKRLVSLYAAWDKPAEAVKWQAKLDAASPKPPLP